MENPPQIAGIGTAVPMTSYTQQEMLDEFGITDPRIRSVFLNSAIERRGLTLPPLMPDGSRATETQGQLLKKHTENGLAMGREAIETCLKDVGATLADVRYLCCVTTTGLLTPGFSALLIKELGIDVHCSRLDVVGMGCNAGLNALTAVAGWANAHPGELALMVCIEACSAAYVFDGTMRSSVVNSLFGDGSAALAVISPAEPAGPAVPTEPVVSADSGWSAARRPAGEAAGALGPGLLKFSSCIIPDAVDAMRYDWDDAQGKFSFYLDPEVPYVVGAHSEIALGRLLEGTGLSRSDISHWVIHSGGKKVIDSVRANLGLSRHDVRHTTGVLRDHGNISSGSFLFSYERLRAEGVTAPGEYGVFMTMGPGSTIEMALVSW
ncbi:MULTISPECIES: 3,5-dihydroxyphenylacetyl-CoA synthase DpgA [unclassified Streptomyces]|uniref:3,5-dihydroxyphenylacetyl-CoA synthase DpgA n=1 Tax=unclassified Streptomyces TaxID=2593676 RepID=UPI002E14C559|nr:MULTISPECIES: 3,5-dihydroxyphenylacetyl-CoA synthase DpgA [unclassified Streptomyces]WSR22539.1 type III polyketide synthase [Streptomyces sp. NBC_01205]